MVCLASRAFLPLNPMILPSMILSQSIRWLTQASILNQGWASVSLDVSRGLMELRLWQMVSNSRSSFASRFAGEMNLPRVQPECASHSF